MRRANSPSCRLWRIALLTTVGLTGCHQSGFPEQPAGYREYAYVANAGANTVSVLDLVYLRQDRTLQVGSAPSALAANPVRNEIYVVNTDSGNVSVIDADATRIAATIPVHRQPASIAVEPTGHRAFIVNAGSNSVSVLDLDKRREIAEVATPEQPGTASLAPDARTLVITHRASGLVSILAVGAVASASTTRPDPALRLRASFKGCPGASAVVILPDSSKAFIACSAGRQVMVLNLAAAPDSWAAKQDGSLTTDRMLTLLEVGLNPVDLALKPDGGEIFVSNGGSGSITEIATTTNEVGGTYMIGTRPTHGIVSRDNSRLFIANSGDDAIGLYSIEEAKVISSLLHTGSSPQNLAFSADEHLLLAIDAHSGDVSVIRTESKLGPNLFTILPAGSSPKAIVTKVVSTPGRP